MDMSYAWTVGLKNILLFPWYCTWLLLVTFSPVIAGAATAGEVIHDSKSVSASSKRDNLNELNRKAETLEKSGNYYAATKLRMEILTKAERSRAFTASEIAKYNDDLAALFVDQGLYDKAYVLYSRALRIREQAHKSNHPIVAKSLKNLANVLAYQGNYTKARAYLDRALLITKSTLGANDIAVASLLIELGRLLIDQGYYSIADQNLSKALSIARLHKGITIYEVAVEDIRALLYFEQGSFENAEQSLQKVIHFRMKQLGVKHPLLVDLYLRQANIHISQRRYRDAELLIEKALTVSNSALGNKHILIARALYLESKLFERLSRFKEGEKAINDALKLQQKFYGTYHPEVANSLNAIGTILQGQALYRQAAIAFKKSHEIQETVFGYDHPIAAKELNSLALNMIMDGEYEEGVLYLKKGLSIQHKWLARELPLMPDQMRDQQVGAFGDYWQIPYGIAESSQAAADLAMENRLNRQGFLQDIELRQALLRNASVSIRRTAKRLSGINRKLGLVSISKAERVVLRVERDRLQAELYRSQPDLQLQIIAPTAVANLLPTDGTLIEFQRFRPYISKNPPNHRWGSAKYIALILSPNGVTTPVLIGSAEEIDTTIQRALSATEQDLTDDRKIWEELSTRLLSPLLPYLKEKKQWFIALDGELNRVPFAALPVPGFPDVYFTDTYGLRLLSAGRELMRLQHPNPKGSRSIVIANPIFSLNSGIDVAKSENLRGERHEPSSIVKMSSSSVWMSLPNSQSEGLGVSSIISANLFKGSAATTTTLLKQKGPLVLHIATHGYFDGNKKRQALEMNKELEAYPRVNIPLWKEEYSLGAGLVLAGANEASDKSKEDGYLTAAQAQNLNLKGTELVVLSACSTGLGREFVGEGLYGLQRSLAVAGARSTLLSLWQVNDEATADFMIRFYTRLKAGESRSEALASVQKDYRDGKTGNPRWRHPYYWAAWQLVGDWRPINGL